MKILVTGASGQLGQAMVRHLAERHDVRARTHRDLDIASWPEVRREMDTASPDAIVNCAAYNDVNAAEDRPVDALSANAWGPRALARAAIETGAVLVHFSTDFVFDGRTDRPYTESDPPCPQGRYGMSKLLGEWLAAEAPTAYVLRVASLFGGPRAKSSVDALLNAILEDRPARPFSDRTVSPSYVLDVVAATVSILQGRPAPGLYHCVNSGCATWLELTRELARLAGRQDARIEPISLAEANLRPPRPLFAALSNAKLTAAGIAMPAWEHALARYVRARLDPTAHPPPV
jgi:dTDP-4-dehydrorhamnose reductase